MADTNKHVFRRTNPSASLRYFLVLMKVASMIAFNVICPHREHLTFRKAIFLEGILKHKLEAAGPP